MTVRIAFPFINSLRHSLNPFDQIQNVGNLQMEQVWSERPVWEQCRNFYALRKLVKIKICVLQGKVGEQKGFIVSLELWIMQI